MSRYPEGDDYDENWALNMGRWQRNLKTTVNSPNGKKILQELKEALEAMPIRELIQGSLVETKLIGYNLEDEHQVMVPTDSYCAIGALAACKGIDVAEFAGEDPDYYEITTELAYELGINQTMAYAIATCNDEATNWRPGTDYRHTPPITNAGRWQYVYKRVCKALEEGVPLV